MMKPTPPPPDAGHEAHRRKVFFIGSVATLLLLVAFVWLVQWIVEQQRLERCLASRRPDCFRIEAPVREGPADLRR